MIRKDAPGTLPPPRQITLDEARNRTPITLQKNQAVTVDLMRHDTLGANWRFSGVPQPSVALLSSTPPPPPNPNVRRVPNKVRHVERYTWSAEQLAGLKGSFSMTATYTRNRIEAGVFQFDFKVKDDDAG